MKGYSKREISELKDQMQRAHDEQLKRITEMVTDCPKLSHALLLDLAMDVNIFFQFSYSVKTRIPCLVALFDNDIDHLLFNQVFF